MARGMRGNRESVFTDLRLWGKVLQSQIDDCRIYPKVNKAIILQKERNRTRLYGGDGGCQFCFESIKVDSSLLFIDVNWRENAIYRCDVLFSVAIKIYIYIYKLTEGF